LPPQVSTDYLRGNLEALQGLLELPEPEVLRLVRRFPPLLVCASPSLAAKLEALQRLLGCSHEALLKLAARQPTLLYMQPARLQQHLGAMAELLAMEPLQAALLCTRQPALLALAPATVAAKLAAIRHACGLPDELLRSMVQAQPQVCCLDTQRLLSRHALLRAAGERAPLWGAQVRSWRPSSLAMVLCRSTQVLLRPLYYLEAVEQQPGRALSTLLALPSAQFGQQYPGFAAWLEARGELELQRCQAQLGQLTEGGQQQGAALQRQEQRQELEQQQQQQQLEKQQQQQEKQLMPRSRGRPRKPVQQAVNVEQAPAQHSQLAAPAAAAAAAASAASAASAAAAASAAVAAGWSSAAWGNWPAGLAADQPYTAEALHFPAEQRGDVQLGPACPAQLDGQPGPVKLLQLHQLLKRTGSSRRVVVEEKADGVMELELVAVG
jgi:hypothetical protein